MPDVEKMAELARRARQEAAKWNAEVDRILAKIKSLPYPPEWWDAIYGDLREARRCAGYWNQIVNHDNGYI